MDKLSTEDMALLKAHNADVKRIGAEIRAARAKAGLDALEDEAKEIFKARLLWLQDMRKRYEMAPEDKVDPDGTIVKTSAVADPMR